MGYLLSLSEVCGLLHEANDYARELPSGLSIIPKGRLKSKEGKVDQNPSGKTHVEQKNVTPRRKDVGRSIIIRTWASLRRCASVSLRRALVVQKILLPLYHEGGALTIDGAQDFFS